MASVSRAFRLWIVVARGVAIAGSIVSITAASQAARGRATAPVSASASVQTVPVAGISVSIAGAPTKGSRSARVAVIEYADFECPYCAAFFRDTLPTLEREYVKTGKVLLVFKHRPISALHPNAVTAASGAECAGEQGSFWAMHDLLFMDQKNLSKAALLTRAMRLGLDSNTFNDCLELGRGAKRVTDDTAAAAALRITGTPTFLMGMLDRRANTVQVRERLEGAGPITDYRPAIDRLIAEAK